MTGSWCRKRSSTGTRWREGDIVVFTHPPRDHCPGPAGTDLVKRVIALPGQTIYSAGGILYIDGWRLR
jgi:hypothetical protein